MRDERVVHDQGSHGGERTERGTVAKPEPTGLHATARSRATSATMPPWTRLRSTSPIAAVREEGQWQVVPLPTRAGSDLDAFLHVLRQQPGEIGTIGFLSVAEDFFVAARVRGEEVRLLLSDVTCVPDWPIAAEVTQAARLAPPRRGGARGVDTGG